MRSTCTRRSTAILLTVALSPSCTMRTTVAAAPGGDGGGVGGFPRGVPRGRPWGSVPGLNFGRSHGRRSTTALHHENVGRGGASSEAAAATTAEGTATATVTTTTTAAGAEEERAEEEPSLDEKVAAAMRKLGLDPDGSGGSGEGGPTAADAECEGGVCELPAAAAEQTVGAASEAPAGQEQDQEPEQEQEQEEEEDVTSMADRISEEMKVDRQIVLAAIGATLPPDANGKVDERAARALIQAEIDAVSAVGEDCDEVRQLISEGHDALLSRRALAFAEMNVDDARAILLADEEDEEEERKIAEEAEARARLREEAQMKKEREEAEATFKEVKVDAGFDPTNPAGAGMEAAAAATGLGLSSTASGNQPAPPQGMPKEAKKADVVFDITTDQIQEIVLESPVPVLLDVYADWCGPCKALAPALEQMATRAGGAFRLVKLNSDNERQVSQALEVRALPTIFGIRDGKVVNMFQGMPRDEAFMRNFMMGLLTGGGFDPPVSAEQKKDFEALSTKLAKVAGAACFPFSARERLQDRTVSRLEDLVAAHGGNMADAEDSARTVRSLLSNVIRDPYEAKFRRVNLENKVIAARIGRYPPCLAILKSVGFAPESKGDDGAAATALMIGRGKKAVNVAPLVVARDCIDKWIDRNRYEIAKAARARNDEIERARLAAEAELAAGDEDEYDSEEEEEEEADPDACSIRLRIEGKKKVHDLAMRADDTLRDLVGRLPSKVEEDEEVQITCTAKRLIVKSTDGDAMGKTLRQHGLMPAAAVVVKVGAGASAGSGAAAGKSSLAERAAARQAKKGGYHTMQSTGIYSKDDNAKGELIDGGGGVWYEHDVTSDDDEAQAEDEAENDEVSKDDGDAEQDSDDDPADA